MKITAVLIGRKLKDGTYPVKIRVSDREHRTHYATGISVEKSQWAKGRVKNNPLYNQIIQREIIRIEEAIYSGRNIREKNYQDFLYYAENLVSLLKPKRSLGRWKIYHVELRRLKRFSPDISFYEINHSWLRKYENFIRSEVTEGNTVVKAWKVLEFFLNTAVSDGILSKNPTKGYEKPKYRQVQKTFLLWEEILQIEALLYKPLSLSMRRVLLYFLLGCYSGLRLSDWYRFNPSFIQGDRIILRAKKNGQIISFKIHERLKKVIEMLDFEPLDMSEQKTREYLVGIAKLAGINKHITTHSARHSFGVRCRDLGCTTAEIADLLGVSERVAQIYSRLTGKHLDEAISRWDAG